MSSMTKTPTPDIVDTPTAADMLGVSPHTLRAARTRGTGALADLPVVRIGRAIRYRVVDIHAWVEAHIDIPANSAAAHGI